MCNLEVMQMAARKLSWTPDDALVTNILSRAYWHSVGMPIDGPSAVEKLYKLVANKRRNARRNARNQAMRDCGLVSYRTSSGAVRWE